MLGRCIQELDISLEATTLATAMSTHGVNVVRLGPITPHPYADSLSYTLIYGYTAIFRTSEFREGDLVVYVEPDYVMPDNDERYAFMGSDRRVRAKRLHGMWSQGLVLPAPPGIREGDDVMYAWGITRYEPVVRESTDDVAGSEIPHDSLRWLPTYGLENLRRHPDLFTDGEPVCITEKLDGMQARFAFREGRLYTGSYREWVRAHPNSPLGRGLKANPWIQEFCRAHDDCVLYAEVLGSQKLKYGFNREKPGVFAFDIRKGINFLDPLDFDSVLDARYRSPGWYEPFSSTAIAEYALSDSWVCPGQMAEGLVVRPMRERTTPGTGRVIAKAVSDRCLAKS